jgi:hypothetical protein
VITFTDRALPPWSGYLAIIGAIANVGAVGGIFALRGPLNSGNGLIGGIAAPLGLYLLWILAISVWWLRHDSTAGEPPSECETDCPGLNRRSRQAPRHDAL